jgi:hypothetical protein
LGTLEKSWGKNQRNNADQKRKGTKGSAAVPGE